MTLARRRWLLGMLAGLVLPAAGEGRAQERRHRVGVLVPAATQWDEAAFRAALHELGYVDGRTLHLEIRSAGGRLPRLPALARELVASNVDVIVAVNYPGTRAAMDATRTVPIVMAAVGDPIALGLVTSLARPAGNVTGVSNMAGDLAAKRLALLREALPSATRIALLFHPDEPIVAPQLRDLAPVARRLRVELRRFPVRGNADVERAFAGIARWRADAVLQLAGQASAVGRRIAGLALEHRVAAMLLQHPDVEAGALLSYFPDQAELFRRVAHYVDRILRGASVAELPVEQPSTFELVVNVRTARALGLQLPPALLLRADRVIE